MRVAHLDCQRGLDENSLLAAFVDIGVTLSTLEPALGHCGFVVPHLAVTTCPDWRAMRRSGPPDGESCSSAATIQELENRIATAPLAPARRQKVLTVLRSLAHATAISRGIAPDALRVRDLGGADVLGPTIACVIACMELQIATLSCSSVGLGAAAPGSASKMQLHPSPVTIELLRGIPLSIWPGDSPCTTPAGAALIRCLATRFGPLPAMTVTQIGYGIPWNHPGQAPEVVRLILGDLQHVSGPEDAVMLETNLDNCSAEIIGYTLEQLFAAGAWDCYTTPIQMKKSRPGVQLSVIAPPHLRSILEGILFRETTTLGVRVRHVERTTLPRREEIWESPWGPIRLKLATLPSGEERGAPEYDDCRGIALATGLPLTEIYDAARMALAARRNLPGGSGTS